MTTNEKIAAIEALVTLRLNLDEHYAALTKTLGYDTESPMITTVERCFSAAVEMTAKLIGDTSGWIDWYIWDNDMGERGMEAGYDNELHPVTSVGQLVELIEKGGER